MREFCIHLHKAENAARDVWSDVLAEVRERLNMPFDGIGVRKQDGIVPPGDLLRPDELFEAEERFHALLPVGNAGFHVFSVRGDCVMEIGAVYLVLFVVGVFPSNV